MLIRIDRSSEEPLYLQIRASIIEAIAREELTVGAALPSVRSLAADLSINLHTVNKAYAVLRDEGYLILRGRSGAYVADPTDNNALRKADIEASKMDTDLYALALAHRARGGSPDEFMHSAQQQVEKAFKGDAL